MILRLAYLLLIIFSFSCNKNEKTNESLVCIKEFKIPTVINSNKLLKNDSTRIIDYEYDHITDNFPIFIGKYKFSDSLIDIDDFKRDSIFYKDYLDFYSTEGKYSSRGFDIIPDYETTIYYNEYEPTSYELFSYYPIFLINTTYSEKIFLAKDSHAFGIQEAILKERYNSWYPIECNSIFGCGNGEFGYLVKPNEFIILLMRKFKGDYETFLRTRIKNGDNILVSKKFKGLINKKQFLLKKGSTPKVLLNEVNKYSVVGLFFGATPLNDSIKK